jgi:hypothetical protein
MLIGEILFANKDLKNNIEVNDDNHYVKKIIEKIENNTKQINTRLSTVEDIISPKNPEGGLSTINKSIDEIISKLITDKNENEKLEYIFRVVDGEIALIQDEIELQQNEINDIKNQIEEIKIKKKQSFLFRLFKK